MRDWKAILGVVLVFCLGGIAGISLDRTVMHHRVLALLQRGSPAYEQLLERTLSRGLDLDDNQRAQFHEILASNVEERRKLQATLQPQVQMLSHQTRQQLRALLNDRQLETLRKNTAYFRHRFGPPQIGTGAGPRHAAAVDSNDFAPSSGTNTAPAVN